MSKINIDLDKLQNEHGHYSEPDVKAVERLTGKPWKEVHEEAEKDETPEKPDKPVSKWTDTEKMAFVDNYGLEEYKKLLR